MIGTRNGRAGAGAMRQRGIPYRRTAFLGAACALALTMPVPDRAAAAAEAQSIAFAIAAVPPAVGPHRVETVYFAGMVDPDDCTAWYSDLPPARSWTWVNNGRNVTRFGLVVAFTVDAGGEPRRATRCLSVDPEQAANAMPTVRVELELCELAPGSPHLRLDDIRQPGVRVQRVTGEHDCR